MILKDKNLLDCRVQDSNRHVPRFGRSHKFYLPHSRSREVSSSGYELGKSVSHWGVELAPLQEDLRPEVKKSLLAELRSARSGELLVRAVAGAMKKDPN